MIEPGLEHLPKSTRELTSLTTPDKQEQRPDDFSVEVDTYDKTNWQQATRHFMDGNLYQTASYENVRSGEGNVSHIILKGKHQVIAAAQARIVKVRRLGVGVAYVRWGPLWQGAAPIEKNLFRQAIRAVKKEYVNRRKLAVRLVPHLHDDEQQSYRRILEEEGYSLNAARSGSRTILMDIRPGLEDLYKGFHQKWRNSLNSARKQDLDVIEGEEEALFEAFEPLYFEMKERKQFSSSTDLTLYRKIQREALAGEKMRVFLASANGDVCAGAICSALGNTGVYLFGATNGKGMKTNASYVLQWRILEWLKEQGCDWYNLNGINPEKNEGTYRFKARLAGSYGHDVRFVGVYEAYPNPAVRLAMRAGEFLRTQIRSLRERLGRS
jgi:lipid II:glycine glycyltransferase (peptidoglycan interpeptide bridge formation enzyme)